MGRVTKSQYRLLRPYILGERPNDKGEVDLHCPLHRDSNRSAQLNVIKGVWYCHAGCGGGSVDNLIDIHDQWEPPPSAAARSNGASSKRRPGESEEFTNEQIEYWHEILTCQTPPEDPQLGYLEEERGISLATVKRFKIGWDEDRNAFTIPVQRPGGDFYTVRFYNPHPRGGRRKIWAIKGRNSPVPFPYQVIESEPEELLICEGEWDALLANQHGFPTVTRTGAARVWKSHWNRLFKGRRVYLVHDMDVTGQAANETIATQLAKVAAEVRIIRLPYPVIEDHGKDLTDFFNDHPRNGPEVLRRLIEQAPPFEPGAEDEPADEEADHVPVDQIIRSENFGKRLTTEVTIRGVQDDNWWAPRKLRHTCTRDAGEKCNECPMFKKGRMDETIEPTDRRILRVIGKEEQTALKYFAQDFARETVPGGRCSKLSGVPEVRRRQPVSKMIAQQLVDTKLDRYHPDNNLKITAAGNYANFPTNVSARLVGIPTSDPNSNRFEFMIERMEEVAISTDYFEPDPETIESLRQFQATDEEPLDKLMKIAGDLETVTGIHGRPEMTAAMDLVFHSALTFDFRRQRLQRGWLELLVCGDTRTGKSETARRLAEHYGAGAIVSCESATMAGIKGATLKMGKGDDKWYISWGALPLNDRRLVVLDEVKGLAPEEIGDLSDVRSSGIVTLVKARTETALARTRAIWLSNPRDGDSVNTYYGVDTLLSLIGSSEDIARFDLALIVRDDVPMEEINRLIDGRPAYPAEACNALIRWAWSRSPEQVVWEDGAEEYVVECANKLIREYIEDPPLIRRGDQRIKLARVAVALAARLFSTDATFERIVVRKEHVRDAARFIDRLFKLPAVGYFEKSHAERGRSKKAIDSRSETIKFVRRQVKQYGPQLIDYLRGRDEFWNRDLQEFLGMDVEAANYFTSQLARYGMLSRGRRGANALTPTFQTVLKEVQP